MDDKEFSEYVNLLMSMSLDFNMGRITRQTFESNLKIIYQKVIDSKLDREQLEDSTWEYQQ